MVHTRMSDSPLTPEEIQAFVESCRPYWLLLYTRGPDRTQDDATVERLQAGHLAHLIVNHRAGRLPVFGPLTDDSAIRGIAVIAVATREEAVEIAEADPAVRAGRLAYEIHPWFAKPGTSLPPV